MDQQNFRYSIDRIRSRFSRAEFLSSLKDYGRFSSSVSFGMREYDAWPRRLATSDTFRRYFGSWGKALQAAGFRTVRGRKLDPKQMVAAFKDCWRQLGSVPSQRQLEDFLERHNFPFRTKSYFAFFGGLGRLAQLIVRVQNGELDETKIFVRRKTNRRIKRTLSWRLRFAVLKRDGYRCVKCGAIPKTKSVSLEIDHIKPVSRGGSSDKGNLQTLCVACNQGKTDQDN